MTIEEIYWETGRIVKDYEPEEMFDFYTSISIHYPIEAEKIKQELLVRDGFCIDGDKYGSLCRESLLESILVAIKGAEGCLLSGNCELALQKLHTARLASKELEDITEKKI